MCFTDSSLPSFLKTKQNVYSVFLRSWGKGRKRRENVGKKAAPLEGNKWTRVRVWRGGKCLGEKAAVPHRERLIITM